MIKKISIAALAIAAALSLTACNQLDSVGRASAQSFEKLLDAVSGQVTADEANNAWSLAAPDGSARFILKKDFTQSTTADVLLETDAQPFIDAGLDTSKLPEGMLNNGKIIVSANIGDEEYTGTGEPALLDSYRMMMKQNRESINYHAALDHFGVDLSGGNMFEWAKDMSTNDKDMVFVLNPQPFIEAGTDPQKVEGWAFAKVEVMDEKGKKSEVDKFLKPFNIQ